MQLLYPHECEPSSLSLNANHVIAFERNNGGQVEKMSKVKNLALQALDMGLPSWGQKGGKERKKGYAFQTGRGVKEAYPQWQRVMDGFSSRLLDVAHTVAKLCLKWAFLAACKVLCKCECKIVAVRLCMALGVSNALPAFAHGPLSLAAADFAQLERRECRPHMHASSPCLPCLLVPSSRSGLWPVCMTTLLLQPQCSVPRCRPVSMLLHAFQAAAVGFGLPADALPERMDLDQEAQPF
eukprot:scaffold142468_cov17-Tisochrysis_lutea.AAC.2